MLTALLERISLHAKQRPQAVALSEGGSMLLSYAELYSTLQENIQWYRNQPWQRLAIDLPNSTDWVIHDLAASVAGKVVVPIPSFFTAAQRAALIKDSGVEVLIDRQGMHTLATRHPLPELPKGTLKITYTSGSTGAPKGVCLSSQQLMRTLNALAERLGTFDVGRHLTVMPLAVLLENIAGVYLGLWLGHQVWVVDSEQLGLMGSSSLCAEVFFGALRQCQPDSLILTPALAQAIVAGVEKGELESSQFRLLAVGGARLPEPIERAARALGLPMVQGYGLSEFCSVVALNDPKQSKPGSVGKPLAHAAVRLEDGEVIVSGNLLLGYLNDPASWYPSSFATGDLGRLDENGYLYIEGRKKNTIVTSFGRNVDPEWLEGLLLLEPSIAQAAVLGDEERELTALLVPRAKPASSAVFERVITAVNQSLPDYAQIKHHYLLDTPFSLANQQLTGTGRLRRAAIRQHYQTLIDQ